MSKEAIKMALEALESLVFNKPFDHRYGDVLAALREALADQPAQQQEPVALPEKTYEFVHTPEPAKWHHPECEGECIACLIEQVVQKAYGSQGLGYLQRHLTSPPTLSLAQRTWVGLTDEDIAVLLTGDASLRTRLDELTPSWIELVKACEAKLKEKNNGN